MSYGTVAASTCERPTYELRVRSKRVWATIGVKEGKRTKKDKENHVFYFSIIQGGHRLYFTIDLLHRVIYT